LKITGSKAQLIERYLESQLVEKSHWEESMKEKLKNQNEMKLNGSSADNQKLLTISSTCIDISRISSHPLATTNSGNNGNMHFSSSLGPSGQSVNPLIGYTNSANGMSSNRYNNNAGRLVRSPLSIPRQTSNLRDNGLQKRFPNSLESRKGDPEDTLLCVDMVKKYLEKEPTLSVSI
jgi:hypothetical protein